MKNKLSLLPILILLFHFTASTQDRSIEFTWVENQEFTTLQKKHASSKEKAVRLLDERKIVYAPNVSGEITERYFYHQQIFINSTEAMDWYTKVYMPILSGNKLLAYNARLITPDGKTSVLKEDDIKEDVDEAGNKVRYYAVSGVSIGSILEYYHVIERAPRVSGLFLNVQTEMSVDSFHFSIRSPNNLIFQANCLNGLPASVASTDTVGTSVFNILSINTKNMPAYEEEKFSAEGSSRMSLSYKLAENTSSGEKNMFGYGALTQRIFSSVNTEASKADQKELKNLLDKSKAQSKKTTFEKVWAVENVIKTNFTYEDFSNEQLEDFQYTLVNKTVNDLGATRLIWNLLQQLEIETEIILTCDRYEKYFPTDFECFSYLDNYLLYIPEIDSYLSPRSTLYRVGLIPMGNLGNNGLFISQVQVGDFNTGLGVVKPIEPFSNEHSTHNMVIELDFTDGFDNVKTIGEQTFTGYYATYYQPYYTYLNESEVKDFNKEIIESWLPNEEIDNIKFKNSGVEKVMLEPFKISCDFKTASFILTAGDKVIFNVGQLIGPQVEMYQEEERKSTIENNFNRTYERTIKFTVPEGYTCENLEALNTSVLPFKQDSKAAGFTSSYTLKDNVVEVKVVEYYNQLQLPKEDIEKYTQVINAAADFNKIALIFIQSKG